MSLTTKPVAVLVKERTAAHHAETENCLLPHLKSTGSIHGYTSLLKMFYGYFLPVQEQIHRQLTTEDLPDIGKRRSAFLILQDLQSLQQPCTAIQQCGNLPLIDNKARAFGALYVLEGSTLGGRMIAKMLLRQPGLNLQWNNLNFFNGYGEATAEKWRSFLEVLNTQTELDSLVSAASQTFLLFKNWINESLNHEHFLKN